MAKYFRVIYWDAQGRRCTTFLEAEQRQHGWGAYVPDDFRKQYLTDVRVEFVGFFDEEDMLPLGRQEVTAEDLEAARRFLNAHPEIQATADALAQGGSDA